MEGFADREADKQNDQQLRNNSKIFEAGTQKRATMQGFADRGGASEMTVVVLGSLTTYSR